MIKIPDQYYDAITNLPDCTMSILYSKTVESKCLGDSIEVYLNDKLYHVINVLEFIEHPSDDHWYKFIKTVTLEIFMSPRYITDDIILFFSKGIGHFYLLRNGHVESYNYFLSFINEREMTYYDIDSYFHVDYYTTYYKKFDEPEISFNSINQPSAFFIDTEKGTMVPNLEILMYEIEKYFKFPFDPKNFCKDLPNLPDEENVSIIINGQEYPIKELREFHSSFLNDQIDDREGNEIILPISKFDRSFECLHFFNSLILERELFTAWLAKFTSQT